MGLLDMVLSVENAGVLKQLGTTFGIGEAETKNAVTQMLPALSRGLAQNSSKPDGFAALMSALSGGGHDKYLDDPQAVGRAETITDGNKILGHLLGSKDVSRQVASHAANETGMDVGIMKKMLPVVATMAMGALSKQSATSGIASSMQQGGQEPTGAMGMLTSFLDADHDGSAMDDILGMARKLF